MSAKAKSKKKQVTREDLMSKYMDYVLEHEKNPKSVYKFTKDIGVEEAEFYAHFGNFDGLKSQIWEHFYQNASQLMDSNEEVMQYGSREKMLTFFFTFFEILTANRSYVIYVLDAHDDMMKNMSQLKGLRKNIKSFAKELIAEDNVDKKFNFLKNSESVFSEGAWIQFLFLLKFWKDDQSPGFEKTDVAIEKSVNTVFDVFDNTPLEKVFDFGKFLYKEQMAK